MSKVLNVLKSIPSAIKRYDEDLPQSNATPGFTGKGLLTALVDTTGSELARRRAMEDEIRNGTGKFLIDNFWKAISLGDPTETARYQDQLLNIYGHDKHIKKWMTEELFPRAEQMRQGIQMFKGAPEGVQPQAPDYGSGGPQQQQQPQQGGPDPELANIYSGLGSILSPPPKPTPTPVPAAGGLLNPPPQAQAQVPMPDTDTRPAFPPQSVEVSKPPLPPAPKFAPLPAPTSPLQSILRKISPTPLTEQQKLEFAEESKQYGAGMSHLNTLETDEAKHRQALEILQEQIKAGRYEKIPKNAQIQTVTNPATGKPAYLAIYNDPDTQKVTYTLLDEYEATKLSSATSSGPKLGQAEGLLDGKTFFALRTINPADNSMRYTNPATGEDITGRFKPNETRLGGVANTGLAQVVTVDASGNPLTTFVRPQENKVYSSAPTAEERNLEAARDRLKPGMEALRTMSTKLIDKIGIAQKLQAAGQSIEATLGHDPEFLTYQDARRALGLTLAAVMNKGRPTEQDAVAALNMIPDPFRDTAASVKLKWDLLGQLVGTSLTAAAPKYPVTPVNAPAGGRGGGGGGSADTVKVLNAQGVPGRIPRSRLADALAHGFKEVK